MLRMCNVWQFRHYLFFLFFSLCIYCISSFLVCCQLTWWIKLTKASNLGTNLSCQSLPRRRKNYRDCYRGTQSGRRRRRLQDQCIWARRTEGLTNERWHRCPTTIQQLTTLVNSFSVHVTSCNTSSARHGTANPHSQPRLIQRRSFMSNWGARESLLPARTYVPTSTVERNFTLSLKMAPLHVSSPSSPPSNCHQYMLVTRFIGLIPKLIEIVVDICLT